MIDALDLPTSEKRITTMSQMHNVYDHLRDNILSLELSPGERLSERVLESRFEASRTPIRAALSRLEAEGLVRRDDRSWSVTPISFREIEQVSEFRRCLEREAIVLACERADDCQIEVAIEMVTSCTIDMPRAEWHRVGTEYHVAIARMTGNEFFVRAIEDVMLRLSRARWLEVWTPEGRERSIREHLHILNLIRERRVPEAVEAITAHGSDVSQRSLGTLMNNIEQRRGLAIIGATA
jgi:DNA-binding GntR family transcriptional regulator